MFSLYGVAGGAHRIANRCPADAEPAATPVMRPETAATRNAPSYLVIDFSRTSTHPFANGDPRGYPADDFCPGVASASWSPPAGARLGGGGAACISAISCAA